VCRLRKRTRVLPCLRAFCAARPLQWCAFATLLRSAYAYVRAHAASRSGAASASDATRVRERAGLRAGWYARRSGDTVWQVGVYAARKGEIICNHNWTIQTNVVGIQRSVERNRTGIHPGTRQNAPAFAMRQAAAQCAYVEPQETRFA